MMLSWVSEESLKIVERLFKECLVSTIYYQNKPEISTCSFESPTFGLQPLPSTLLEAAPDQASSNSYASLVIWKLQCASITRQTHTLNNS